MNIINTVGDLKKALSVYDDNLPLVINDQFRNTYSLNNDTQLCRVDNCGDIYFQVGLVAKGNA